MGFVDLRSYGATADLILTVRQPSHVCGGNRSGGCSRRSANVVGIADHLDDHSLHRFVAHNTNRTLRFHYEAFTFEGAGVGIIRIDVAQGRPLFPTRDIGELRKGRSTSAEAALQTHER